MWAIVTLMSLLVAFCNLDLSIAQIQCGDCEVYTWTSTSTYYNSTCSFIGGGYPIYSRCQGCCRDNYYYYPVPGTIYDNSQGCKPSCAEKKTTTLICHDVDGNTVYSTYEYDIIKECSCQLCNQKSAPFPSSGYNILYATADDNMHLFVDGMYQSKPINGWNQVDMYEIPKCAKCIVVYYRDTQDVRTGFIANGWSTATSTPGNWKCSLTFTAGWLLCKSTASVPLVTSETNGDGTWPWGDNLPNLGTRSWINPGSYSNVAPPGTGPNAYCWLTLP